MSLKIPTLFDKRTAYDFFRDFLTMNSQRRGFSQRAISQKMGWPVSYLPDLMKRRKVFTVKRAVEFGKYVRMAPIDFEKLIYLAILDSKFIDEKDFQRITGTKSSERRSPTKDLELLSATTFIIFEVIRWLHGKATMELLCEIASKKEIPVSTVQSTVLLLIKKNLIEKRGNKFKSLKDFLVSDDESKNDLIGKELHYEFTQLQAKYFAAPFGPAICNSAIVHIERSRFDDIADRIVALRNWIFEISKTDSEQPIEADVRLFQLDFNLTPILDKAASKKIRQI